MIKPRASLSKWRRRRSLAGDPTLCLLACSHYTFASYLYGENGQDPHTGTPLSAPFERNKLTVAMTGVVAVLQACWFGFAVIPLVPVLGAFLPVVLLVAFVVLVMFVVVL